MASVRRSSSLTSAAFYLAVATSLYLLSALLECKSCEEVSRGILVGKTTTARFSNVAKTQAGANGATSTKLAVGSTALSAFLFAVTAFVAAKRKGTSLIMAPSSRP